MSPVQVQDLRGAIWSTSQLPVLQEDGPLMSQEKKKRQGSLPPSEFGSCMRNIGPVREETAGLTPGWVMIWSMLGEKMGCPCGGKG